MQLFNLKHDNVWRIYWVPIMQCIIYASAVKHDMHMLIQRHQDLNPQLNRPSVLDIIEIIKLLI